MSKINIAIKKSLIVVLITLIASSFFLLPVLFGVPAQFAHAAINPEINYQAKLEDSSGNAVADDTYTIEFKLYTDPTGGSAIWTESNDVETINGLLSVMLGNNVSLSNINFNQTLYLGINVEEDGEMTPRKKLGAVPAAFEADKLDGIDSAQFFRNDITNATNTATTSLDIRQNGAGDVAKFLGSSGTGLIIDSSGKVGVGTATPSTFLHVSGNDPIEGMLAKFERLSANEKSLYLGSAGADYAYLSSEGALRFRTGVTVGAPYSSGTTAMNITANGNVGIGTTTPASLLSLYKSAANTYLTIDADANQQAGIEFKKGGVSKWVQYVAGGSNDLTFFNGSTNALTLTNSGALTVTGAITGTTYSMTGDGSAYNVNRRDNNNAAFMIYSQSGDLSFYDTAGTPGDRLTIKSSTGNVGIATTSPYAKLSVDGDFALTGGIYDKNATRGTNGFVLKTTGTGVEWVATSSLGIVGNMAIGSAVTSGTSGSVLYVDSSGNLAQDNAGFYYDATKNYLNLGTSTDALVIGDITGNARGANAIDIQSSRSTATQVASGAQSVAVGLKNTASDHYSSAVGNINNASGGYSSAVGYGNTASAYYSSAFGYTNTASNSYSSAVGYYNNASGYVSSAVGYGNAASGEQSSAFGSSNIASGYVSSAVGYTNNASGEQSSAFGYSNTASSYYSSAVGYSNIASGYISSAVGYTNTASESFSSAIGFYNEATHVLSSAIGNSNDALAEYSSAVGVSNITSGQYSSAVGYGNNASNFFSSAVGYTNTASGEASSAIGGNNTASGQASSAIGYYNIASGYVSSAVGYGNTASNTYSLAVGYDNYALSAYSSSIGYSNFISTGAEYANALGTDNYINSSSDYASAVGYSNYINSTALRSSAFGYDNTVNTNIDDAYVFGDTNTAAADGAGIVGANLTNDTANSLMLGPSQGNTIHILSTGEVKLPYLTATSTTATSTFNGGVKLVQSSDSANRGLWISATDGDYRSIYMNTSQVLSFAGGAGNTATLNAAGEWTNASDISIKSDITGLNYGLTELMDLLPRRYKVKAGQNELGEDIYIETIGFVAQEMEDVLPELVHGEEGTKGISYGNLVTVAVNAIQEIGKKIGLLNAPTSTPSIVLNEDGDVSLTNSLGVSGLATVDGLIVGSTTSQFSGAIAVNSTATSSFTGDLEIKNNLSVENGLFVNGNINIKNATNSITFDVNGINSSGNFSITSGLKNSIYINEEGYIGIGTTSPSRPLHVFNETGGSSVRFQNSNAYCEIDPLTSTWSCTSDENLKENINSLSSENELEKLRQLRPVNFEWKSDETNETRTGLIAQEVEKIIPELVKTDKETGIKSVGYGGFVTYIISAVQELANKIDELTKRIEEIANNSYATVIGAFQKIIIGTPQKPGGIQMYDENTGDPYCLTIKDGNMVTRFGDCDDHLEEIKEETTTYNLEEDNIEIYNASDNTEIEAETELETEIEVEPTPEIVTEIEMETEIEPEPQVDTETDLEIES